MLEVIKYMGEMAADREGSGSILKSLVIQEDRPREEKRFIVVLDIDTRTPKLDTEIWEIDDEKLERILWVGNPRGNNPQDRLTTNEPTYLLSQTVPNLIEKLEPAGELRPVLEKLKQCVFYEIQGVGGTEARYRFVWRMDKLGLEGNDLLTSKEQKKLEKILNNHQFGTPGFFQAFMEQDKKVKAKDLIELVGQVLENWVAKKLDVSKKQIALYTLRVDGMLVAAHPEYQSYLQRSLIDDIFQDDSTEGNCYICPNQSVQVTKDVTRFRLLKFYINDKLGFASGIKKEGFYRNYALCRDCYTHLLAGERLVENMLRSRLGGAEVFIIPDFYHLPSTARIPFREWSGYLKDKVNGLNNLEAWHNFQNEITRYQHFESQKESYLLNFLFVKRSKSEVRIQRLIQDVPPSRLDELNEARGSAISFAGQYLTLPGFESGYDLNLVQIYYLLPLRKTRNEVQNGTFFDLIEALLANKPLQLSTVVEWLMETARIHALERYGAYVQNPSKGKGTVTDLDRFLILSQIFLYYLRRLGLLIQYGGGETRLFTGELLPAATRDYMNELGLSEPQQALFMLGVLIGYVANEQYHIDKKKPILNKLIFQGMNEAKVRILSVEIYEKMVQYRINQYYEGLYAAMKELLDRNRDRLSSAEENVYWILSGYAYSTAQALRGGAQRSAEN